jgi:4-hydroxythreonine-4-phosphate dehydrogenase
MNKPTIALTMGDPTGVGCEILVKALSRKSLLEKCRLIIIGDMGLLSAAAKRFAPPRVLKAINNAPAFSGIPGPGEIKNQSLTVISLSSFRLDEIKLGRPGPAEGRAMREYIETAVELIQRKAAQALVTAPINKKAMLAGGSRFGGHTELLAHLTGTDQVVMMLENSGLRVALVTTHIPLSRVSKAITTEKIFSTIMMVHEGLRKNFQIKRPRILVAGLNPHAGEGGVLGDEEQNIIAPAVAEVQSRKILAQGPLPPDTLFTKNALKLADAVICMYHDQGLIPIKMLGLEKTVNITLGLPFVRTSPGHGTAPDIAWKGKASEKSLASAIGTALKMLEARRKQN